MANNSLDALNMNVLNVARDEYTTQLNKIITPLILDGIISLYNDSSNTETPEDDTNVKRIIRFQRLLQNVPQWNQKVINDECDRIRQICSWIEQLSTAVFVTHVKILTSVKLNKESKHFNFSVPNFENFIHNVYINTAKSVFMKPYNIQMFYESNNFKANRDCVNDIENAVEDSVRELLPVQEILNIYMSTDEGDLVNDDESEASDQNEESDAEDEIRDFNINEKGDEVIQPNDEDEDPDTEEVAGVEPTIPEDDTAQEANTPTDSPKSSLSSGEAVPVIEPLDNAAISGDELDDDIKELGSNYKSYNPKDQ